MDVAWFQSRYDKPGPGGTGADYLNCPMDRDQYERFVAALVAGAGLVLASHLVPGTKFPCPQGGTMLTSCGEGMWRGRPTAGTAGPPVCP